MKKIIKPKSILFMLTFAFLFAFFSVMVNAYSQSGITSLNVESGNLQIIVSGTTEDELTAVSISVYESDGVTLAKMKTSSVGDDNKFSETIPLEKGTYVVKVANYDGGEVVSKENVIVNEETEKQKSESEEPGTDVESEFEKQKSESENKKINKIKKDEQNSEKDKQSHTKVTTASSVSSTKNPKTSDNVIMLATLLATCSIGSLSAIKFRKNKK